MPSNGPQIPKVASREGCVTSCCVTAPNLLDPLAPILTCRAKGSPAPWELDAEVTSINAFGRDSLGMLSL